MTIIETCELISWQKLAPRLERAFHSRLVDQPIDPQSREHLIYWTLVNLIGGNARLEDWREIGPALATLVEGILAEQGDRVSPEWIRLQHALAELRHPRFGKNPAPVLNSFHEHSLSRN